MKKVIVITGASSGFRELTAHELAKAGHVVYASMRETKDATHRKLTRQRSLRQKIRSISVPSNWMWLRRNRWMRRFNRS
jgi:NADP-dependent 3-hydroxy acid dehydrogenase YdfG